MSVAGLRKIGALIREQRHVLISRWRHQVRQLSSAKGLDVPSLNDHMPYLIDELAEALEAQPDGSAGDVLLQGSPPVHGRQRLHDGFNVEEVVAEYNVLRGCVHDLAEEHGMVIHGAELRVVNRIIDEAIGLAVQTYATQLSLEIKKHRDQHIAFVANDLRTPLQAISVSVRVIERTMDAAASNPQAEKLLKVLRRNIQQLEKSVTEVIKANGDSPTEASTKLDCRQIDLWPLVESVVDGLAPVIASSSVELLNNVSPDMQVFADAGLLTRVLENILAFAINAAPRGIVRVEANDDDRLGVCCKVHHNGAPLSEIAIAAIFDDDESKDAASDAIGLNLSLVKHSIEAHGGSVSANSSEDAGTTIEFNLPTGDRST